MTPLTIEVLLEMGFEDVTQNGETFAKDGVVILNLDYGYYHHAKQVETKEAVEQLLNQHNEKR